MNLPNNVRLRPDLVLQPQDSSSGTWIVKDPVSLRYFLFGADEHFFLQRLDGSRTMTQLINEFARERAPRKMTPRRLQLFLYDLFRKGLVCTDATSHGERLLESENQQIRRDTVATATNLLAIRLPGINPTGLLDWLYARTRWCFSWTLFLVCVLVGCWATLIAISEFSVLANEIPRVDQFLQGRNLLWLAIALAGTKILHELGHALTCRHFGGSCHELGIMFLLFTPCLYCNVTDAWILRSRWQRIAIAAAGIIVELQLAALAVIVWHYTLPGPLHSIVLNITIVCTVGTLLFNGNPLLKFDGYFILSDLCGTPNLWEQSRNCLRERIVRLLVRDPRPGLPRPEPYSGWLAAYATASIVYRVVLLTTIGLFLYRALHPLGLDLIFVLMAAVVVGSMSFSAVMSLAAWFRRPGKLRHLRIVSTASLALAAMTLAGAIFALPLPSRISAPISLQSRDAVRIYASTPGRLVRAIDYGNDVVAGEKLAQLANAELQSELIDIIGQLQRAESRTRVLETSAAADPLAMAQLHVTRALVTDLSEQVRLKSHENTELSIQSPRAGTFIAPPPVGELAEESAEMPNWTRAPLDHVNRNCYIERGTLIGMVADTTACEAIAFVDEVDVRYVRVGQSARVQLSHSKSQIVDGEVTEIAKLNASEIPSELAAMNDLDADQATGGTTPLRTVYQIRIALGPLDGCQLIGVRGRAKIEITPQTIAQRGLRWLHRTLKTEAASGF